MEKLVDHFVEHLMLDLDFNTPLDKDLLEELLGDTEIGERLSKQLQTDEEVEDFVVAIADGLKDKIIDFIKEELYNEINDFASS